MDGRIIMDESLGFKILSRSNEYHRCKVLLVSVSGLTGHVSTKKLSLSCAYFTAVARLHDKRYRHCTFYIQRIK